jgi:RNA polymerase sigma-70 factor, ECF subfamily
MSITPSPLPPRTPSPAATDEELWMRFIAQDCQASFDLLHRRYSDPLRAWIRRCGVRDEARVHDLAQDVWVRLVKNRERFNPAMKWGTWSFHVAKNVARNEGRRLQRRFVTPEADFRLDEDGVHMPSAQSAERPEEMMRERMLAERLEEVVRGLTVEQRRIFTLRFFEGRSNEEVARLLAIPLSAMKAKAKRVRLRVLGEMRDLLGDSD